MIHEPLRCKEVIVDKKTYYKKNHFDCPCCGWQGHVSKNTRKWLSFKRIKKIVYNAKYIDGIMRGMINA